MKNGTCTGYLRNNANVPVLPIVSEVCRSLSYTRTVLPTLQRQIRGLCDALGYLHDQVNPIIHRDIKPVRRQTCSCVTITLTHDPTAQCSHL